MFIKNFAQITDPLTAFTHHDTKFVWTSGHHTAFSTLKITFLEAPVLHYPDPSKCYIVYADASDDACGARLSQKHDGQELQLHFFPTHSQTSQRNESLQNRKPMAFTLL